MNSSPQAADPDDEEAIDPAILAILRDLPCEQGEPSAGTDLAIRRAAAARMAALRRRSRLKWVSATVAAMAACLLLGMYLNNPSIPEKSKTVDLSHDDAATILREVSILFPGQIQAIQRDGTGLHLTLSDAPDVDSTMAVVIKIGGDGDSREIITFSGQTIELMGRSVTVQANPDREILLNGQNIEWWNTQSAPHLSVRTLSI